MCLRENSSIFEEDKELIALSGEPLDYALRTFDEESERKRGYRILHHLLHQELPDDVSIRHPVYVTKQEREECSKIERLTIREIAKRIENSINQFDNKDVRQNYRNIFVKTVKRRKKEIHVNFYNELTDALELQKSEESRFELDEED